MKILIFFNMTTRVYFSQYICLLICIFTFFTGFSQHKTDDWQLLTNTLESSSKETFMNTYPENYLSYYIDSNQFLLALDQLDRQEIQIPTPNGSFETFVINTSVIIDSTVAHLYTIKTYSGYQKDNPSVLIACDISDAGFHAAVYKSTDSYFITPAFKNNPNDLIVYYKKDELNNGVQCNASTIDVVTRTIATTNFRTKSATSKETFRLAIAASGEYSQQFGGSPVSITAVLNALASGVNMINPIYLRDLGVSFNLVSNAALVFTDPNSDPFDPSGTNLPLESHTACVNALTVNGFDVGHTVLWANIGGAAFIDTTCWDQWKGQGYSGNISSLQTLWVDYVSHELGHQFGSDHNFASQECGTSVNNLRFEPGEGSSIMAYAGVCGPVPSYSNTADPFFHWASIDQIRMAFTNFTSCAAMDATGNSANPVANANNDITLPKGTPFILVGSATDANDPINALSYNWVQYDSGSIAVSGSPNCNSTTAPLFRYRGPTVENYRSFPQYSDILAGNNDQMWEKLPCTARTMNFSLLVRDNNTSFGRIHEDKNVVTVANTGPFEVATPNGGESLMGNVSSNITWTVNGTNSHCPNVDILVSTDGGNTYTIVADAVANSGSQNIIIPNVNSTMARVLVRCDVAGGFRSASTFYDVSNANFTIIEDTASLDSFELLGITMYPNPASELVTINLSNNEKFKYNLFDLNGKRLYNGYFKESTTINVSNLSSGVYFLQLKQVDTGKLLVQKLVIDN